MNQPIDTIDCDGMTIKIWQDLHANNPRTEWDNLGTMTCFHGRYQLGDKHTMSQDELRAIVEREDVISLPLYLYDHSGITMSTGPFSCPWDSGQVGYIWAEKKSLLCELCTEENWRQKAEEWLQSEVDTYDHYLTGRVYGFTIESAAGDVLESCWGYYGDPEESGCISEAKDNIEWHRQQFADTFGQKTGEVE